MTLLQIMPDNRPDQISLRTDEQDTIAAALRPYGVEFDRWPTVPGFDRDGSPESILRTYAMETDRLVERRGFRLVDVARVRPDGAPDWPERAHKARHTFLNEHRHAEDEVRFFAAGHGCFYLHLDGDVCAVVCTEGDLLSVPAGTLHWFDMGERPDFVAIRFFQEEDGWIGDFTGNPISGRFPTLDELLVVP